MGRQLVLILLSLTLWTCSNSYNDEKIQTEHSNDSLKFIETLPLKCDSAFIQGTKYLACSSENKKLTVTNSSGDTVYKHAYFCARAEFVDFDNDNSKDILFHYLSNVGDVHDLALFDTKTKTFILVDNLSNYPEPKRIDETKYYYSYHRSGCADSNWDSDLFYIDNFKTYKVGNIAGRDCNDVLADVGIFISKISSTKTIPYDTLEIDTIYKYQDDKWDFIADYWTKNYRKFVGTKKNGL